MLEINELCVTFSNRRAQVRAVDRFSLRLVAGERFGLVGESGSGKSTVLKSILGLAPITSGEVLVDGRSVKEWPLNWLYRKVQLVFQDPYASLHPRQTVDRVLAETLHLQGVSDIDSIIGRLLDQVGLSSRFRFRYPHELSGGQRQRVAIARALAARPLLLLLDEPTSALDVSVQAEILNLLTDIVADQKLTMIMVSHDLAVIGHMCDRLAIMRRGSVVEEISAHQLALGDVKRDYSCTLLAAAGGIPVASENLSMTEKVAKRRA